MKSLLSLILLFNVFITSAQIELVTCKVEKYTDQFGKLTSTPIFKQNWLNDSTLIIETVAFLNSIGVHDPRIEKYGPFLSLEFDQSIKDTINNEIVLINADGLECFYINWEITGVTKDSDFIIIQNRQISSDQKKRRLGRLLKSYELDRDNWTCYIKNTIDRKGLKQGWHEIKYDDHTAMIRYRNGIKY